MSQIPNTRGNPQASDLAVQTALPMVGSLSREDLQTTLNLIDAELAKAFEDRNVLLSGGGLMVVNSDASAITSVSEDMKIHLNSKVAGGAPTVIVVRAMAQSISLATEGSMAYVVVNRSAGTLTYTDSATSLPAVTSANQEVFLICKRVNGKIYFRNGAVLKQNYTSDFTSSYSDAITVNTSIPLITNISNPTLSAALTATDDKLTKLFANGNMQLADGGIITYLGTTVQFTEDLKLHINSKVAGGAPVIKTIALGTYNTTANNDMLYVTIDNRTANTTLTITAASTLPVVDHTNVEVILIAKRIDSGDGVKRLYFRNGSAFSEGDSARLGSSGSGSGDASSLTTRLLDKFADSTYKQLSAVDFATDADAHINGSSTGTYSLITKTFELDNSETLISTQLLSADEFLPNGKDITKASLSVFWKEGSIPTNAATYALSRNGGNDYAAITMSRVGSASNTFEGELDLAAAFPATSVLLKSITSDGSSVELGGSSHSSNYQALSQKFSIISNTEVTSATIRLQRSDVSSGTCTAYIYSDSAGLPNASVATGSTVNWSSLPLNTPTDAQFTFTANLAIGTYHLVLLTDATYKTTADGLAGGNEIYFGADADDGASRFDGSVWSNYPFALKGLAYTLTGYSTEYLSPLSSQSGIAAGPFDLDATNQKSLSEKFVLASTQKVKQLEFNFTKTGSPSGNVRIALYSDSAGLPSTLLIESAAIPISSISSGVTVLTLEKVLAAGTYHAVVSTDAAYQASYSNGVTELSLKGDASANGASQFNGTAWSDFSANSLYLRVLGYILDLRLKITANASSGAGKLLGYGIFYEQESGSVVGGIKKLDRQTLVTTTYADTPLTLSFLPDPDLLEIYYVERGQVFKYPAFTINGYTISFPTGTFYNGGITENVTLLFSQLEGSSFDNSDANANKLATLTQFKTKSSAYTAVNLDKIFADSSGGAFTITLPASPSFGDVIEMFDPTDTWDTANVTVGRNSQLINGAASDLTLNVEGAQVKLIYFGGSQGWRVY